MNLTTVKLYDIELTDENGKKHLTPGVSMENALHIRLTSGEILKFQLDKLPQNVVIIKTHNVIEL